MPGSYPNGSDYQQAVQTPRAAFSDPELAGGQPDTNAMGLPVVFSGAFASVFRFSTPAGRRWAVKCFTREISDRDQRYRAISSHLQRMNKAWQVGFAYESAGIRVSGQSYPIVKMEWVPDCRGLDRWLEANRHDSSRVLFVASQIATIVADLEAAGASHGDLQHGNLLVTPADQVRLIDYDGMFVPGLEQLGAAENGHRNYQSPARSSSEFGPGLDRFSAWLIWCSLVAIAADPGLWDQLHIDGDEKLLLSDNDFLDLRLSPSIIAMRASLDQQVAAIAGVLETLLACDLNAIPALDPARYPILQTATSSPSPTPAAQWRQQAGAASSTASGTPSWMGGNGAAARVSPPAGTPSASAPPAALGRTSAGGAWLSSHLLVPPVQLTKPSDRLQTAARACLALACICIAATTALAVVAPAATWPARALGLLFAVFAITAVVILHCGWYRCPERNGAVNARRAARDAGKDAENSRTYVISLEEARAKLVRDETKDIELFAKDRQAIATKEQHEIQKLDNDLREQLRKLDMSIGELAAREAAEKAGVLRQLQEAHVTAALEGERLHTGSVAGIGDSLVAALARCGIATAADFNDMVSGGSGRSKTASLRLTQGRYVYVPGIGEKKASALVAWRRSKEANARRTQPTQIPPAEAGKISANYNNQRSSLESQKTTARQGMQRPKADAASAAKLANERWDRRLEASRKDYAQRRAAIDQTLIAARQAQTQREFKAAHADAVAASFEQIRVHRYVQAVIATAP